MRAPPRHLRLLLPSLGLGLLALALPSRRAAHGGKPVTGPATAPASLAVAVPIEDEGGRALAGFRARLQELRRGKRTRVRVTHWGDSHVASDVFTGTLRSLLQQAYGDGGPGLILPGKPWPTYYHARVKTGAERGWRSERLWAKYGRGRARPRDDLFGVAGISVHSLRETRAWLELRGASTAPAAREVRAVDLFLLRQPGGGRLEVRSAERRLRWVFTVASEKEADIVHVPLPPRTRRIELRAGLGEVRLFAADLASGQRGVVYDTLGINGARASVMLGWNESLMKEQLAHLAPDLVVLAYGTNEVDSDRLTAASFAKSFDEVLARLRRTAPAHAACLVVGPPDRGNWRRGGGWELPENLAVIVAEERRLARARGCAFWDQRAAMGGAGSITRWLSADPPLAQGDRVHLTGLGYRQLAQVLYQALVAEPAKPLKR